MKIIVDATWIAGQYGSDNINGGYRVVDNFIRQLYQYPQHTFYLTHTTHRKSYTDNLKRYHQAIDYPKNIIVSAISSFLLDKPVVSGFYSKLNNKIPLSSIIPFINPVHMARSDIFYASLDIIPYAIRKNKRIKKFFTALDLIPLVRPDLSDLFYNYTKSLYDKVSNDISVFAISQSTKNDLLRYRPDLKPEQITVTHLAANEEVFYPVEEQAEIDKVLSKYGLEGKNYFLTINSLAPYKNSRFVIESFLEWIEDGQIKDLELVFIGKPLSRDYAADLKERISVMDKIILIEKIPDADLAALYSGAMAFLYMSLYEGFGLPILEAMQCGVPVICSNTSSLPEVAGQAAIIVNPTDRPAFIEAMKCMYKDGESRKKYSALGFEQSKNFSWQKYTDQVIHSFQDAVNGSNLLN